ncbi:hypothetical protein [Natronorubrum sp. DTA28]|uniref:hypothetical protein n=1 Tax=Natronorubrum sp. DTA28 TaxID=3447019 RepID=UPI003F86EEDA
MDDDDRTTNGDSEDVDNDHYTVDTGEIVDLEAALDGDEMRIPSLNQADYTILVYLYHHTADVPANIANSTDYNRTYIQQRCNRLQEWDLLHNRGHGVYELSDSTRNVVDVTLTN